MSTAIFLTPHGNDALGDVVICKNPDCGWSIHAASLRYASCPNHGGAAFMSDGDVKRLRCHSATACTNLAEHVFDSRDPAACPLCRKHRKD